MNPSPKLHSKLNASQDTTVVCQPPFGPLYGINTTSSRLPADGTGKPLPRTARRTLQLVNSTFASEVIYFKYLKSIGRAIKDLGFME